jgi:hypothetical protein
MTHQAIADECEALGMKVERRADVNARSYVASYAVPGPQVYWRTSTLGGLLGLPRVAGHGRDTHVRNLKELRYFVKG